MNSNFVDYSKTLEANNMSLLLLPDGEDVASLPRTHLWMVAFEWCCLIAPYITVIDNHQRILAEPQVCRCQHWIVRHS